MADLNLPLRVTRQVLYWFEPSADAAGFEEGNLPVYLFEAPPGEPMVYGFPRIGPASEGVRVALRGSNESCTADTLHREVDASDEQLIRERRESTMPDLAGKLLRASTCLYTMTPDGHFILNRHPTSDRVILAAGFSGHGFKFAPIIGEALADVAMSEQTSRDMGLFCCRDSPRELGSAVCQLLNRRSRDYTFIEIVAQHNKMTPFGETARRPEILRSS